MTITLEGFRLMAQGLHGLVMDVALLASAASLIWAAVGDVRHYSIPNRLPACLALAFLAMACVMKPAFIEGGLVTGLGVLAVGVLLFARRIMGGGDVKLIAAVGLWCGPGLLAPFALVTSVAGAALAIFMLSPLRVLLPAPPQRVWVGETAVVSAPRQAAPFGVAIAVGGLWVLSRYVMMILSHAQV